MHWCSFFFLLLLANNIGYKRVWDTSKLLIGHHKLIATCSGWWRCTNSTQMSLFIFLHSTWNSRQNILSTSTFKTLLSCRHQWTLSFWVNLTFLDCYQPKSMSNGLTKTKPRIFYKLNIRVTWLLLTIMQTSVNANFLSKWDIFW